MNLKKQLFTTFGPLFASVVIVGGVLTLPISEKKVSDQVIDKASTSMSINVIKGKLIRNQAMSNKSYVPFFGSSELSRINAFHPVTIAQKYQRGYQPFLLGAPGTQSLSHFFMLQSMGKEMEKRKAVFIISPQWFVKKGVKPEMFSLYFSPLQTYQWLNGLTKISQEDQYLAKRLLTFPNICADTALKTVLIQISEGEAITKEQKVNWRFKEAIYSREDKLFAQLGLISKNKKVLSAMKKLPDTYNYDVLDKLAYKQGKKATNNNPFEINNHFYKQNILPVERHLKGAQKEFDYRYSPEFSDFQLVLNEMAKRQMDVLFVIPPVNEKWSNYTGLSQKMLAEFDRKITYQLKTQNFTNICDLSQDKNVPYFMEDTIHLGWRGWLAMDQSVAPFLKNKKAATNSYQINSYFLTPDWQNKNPKEIPF